VKTDWAALDKAFQQMDSYKPKVKNKIPITAVSFCFMEKL
jgi:hypothetical protein